MLIYTSHTCTSKSFNSIIEDVGALENPESGITAVATDVAPLICATRSRAPVSDYGIINKKYQL